MFRIQIQEIYPDQFTDILEIIAETWEPTYRDILTQGQIRYMQQEIYSITSLQQQHAAGQRFFVLYENDLPLAFASYSEIEPHVFKLNKIYVKPSGQGKGYGQMLLGFIEQEVKKRDGRWLQLNVNRFNSARNFYEKLRFTVLREEDIPIGPYWMNDYVLQKALTN